MHFYKSTSFLDDLILEDCPAMDLTVELLGIKNEPGELLCSAKQDCVLAGVEEAADLWRACGAEVALAARNGERWAADEIFLTAHGSAAQLHQGLKIAQNVMEYMSGIATRTAEMLARARAVNPGVHVAVTRKNFPGSKRLCLEAATCAGACIHRLGLSDSVLVFDQHRVFLREQTGNQSPLALFAERIPDLKHALPEKKISAEVDTPEEALLLARAGLDIIQCEKFTCTDLTATVRQIRALGTDTLVLAAGGIRADNAAAYAATGVDVLVTSWVYHGRPADIRIIVKPVQSISHLK